MPIDLYFLQESAPCTAVILTAKAIEIKLNLIPVNLSKNEHLKPEFVKINPQHTVPTLVDDGFILWESRAITVYLVEKYGKKDNSLFPTDPSKRAVINQRLHFDLGTLYQRFSEVYYPWLFEGKSIVLKEKLNKLEEALEFLEIFLSKNTFAAGDKLTVADFSLATTVTTIQSVDYDISKFTNIIRWLSKVKDEFPDFEEINQKSVKAFRQLYLDELIKKELIIQ